MSTKHSVRIVLVMYSTSFYYSEFISSRLFPRLGCVKLRGGEPRETDIGIKEHLALLASQTSAFNMFSCRTGLSQPHLRFIHIFNPTFNLRLPLLFPSSLPPLHPCSEEKLWGRSTPSHCPLGCSDVNRSSTLSGSWI